MMTCGLCGTLWVPTEGHLCMFTGERHQAIFTRPLRWNWQEAQLGAEHWRKASVQEYGRKQALVCGAGD
jgi:hypothetical protein